MHRANAGGGPIKGKGRTRQGIKRPHCVPAAIMGGPNEVIDAISILGELPEDLGLLLWRTARDVMLWAVTPYDLRGNLFAEESADARVTRLLATDLPAAISASVDTIHGMLTLGARADASVLSICCLEIAAWARKEGFGETAVTFAQAGGVAAPEFGDAALHTGMYALRAGQVARAVTWLRRAVAVSRKECNRPAFCAALAELGALYESHGDAEQAERHFRLAYRAARKFTSRNARIQAAHGLFRLARAKGDVASAAQFALAAQRSYDPDAGSRPALLIDLARFWTDLDQASHAQDALRRMGPVVLRSLHRPALLSVLAMTARVAAVAGNAGQMEEEARAAWALVSDEAIPEAIRFAAVLDLAHAARVTGDLVSFTHARRTALRLAPHAEFPTVSKEMAEMWPGGEKAPQTMERAS